MATCLSYLSKLITLYKFGSPSRVTWTPCTTLWAIYSEDIPMPFITPCLLFNIFFSLTRKGKLYHPPAYNCSRIESVLNNFLIMASPLTLYERLSCLLTDCQIFLSNRNRHPSLSRLKETVAYWSKPHQIWPNPGLKLCFHVCTLVCSTLPHFACKSHSFLWVFCILG